MKSKESRECLEDLRRRCEAAEARAENAESEIRRLAGDNELLLRQRILLWTASRERCRHVSETEAGDRIALMLSDAIPMTPEAVSRSFLGLNLYGWMSMPEEITSIFGLELAVARWRQQLSDNAIGHGPGSKFPPAIRHLN